MGKKLIKKLYRNSIYDFFTAKSLKEKKVKQSLCLKIHKLIKSVRKEAQLSGNFISERNPFNRIRMLAYKFVELNG